MSVFARRLKEARLRAGLSQEQLGILAGLDEMSASTRMNRYELDKRIPTPTLVEAFGRVLGVPAPYFYAEDEDMAELLLLLEGLSTPQRGQVLAVAKAIKEGR